MIVAVVLCYIMMFVRLFQNLDEVQSYDLYCSFLVHDYRGSRKELKVSDELNTTVRLSEKEGNNSYIKLHSITLQIYTITL